MVCSTHYITETRELWELLELPTQQHYIGLKKEVSILSQNSKTRKKCITDKSATDNAILILCYYNVEHGVFWHFATKMSNQL